MSLVAVLSVALWTLLVEVNCSFYIEIGGGTRLMRENTAGLFKPNIPEFKPGLYSCKNENGEDGQVNVSCTEVNCWRKLTIYMKTNFFIVHNVVLKPTQKLHLSGKDIVEPPEVMVVGFNPKAIDSPRFEAQPTRCADTLYDAVASFIDIGYLPENNAELVNAVTDYLCASDIYDILRDPADARERLFPAVRHILVSCMTEYDSLIKPALKRASTIKSTMSTVTSTQSSIILPDTISKARLEGVMEIMMNKLIDPCVLMHSGLSKEDASWINISCKISCQFLSTAAEVFGQFIAINCNYLKDGYCNNGACTCIQWLGYKRNSLKIDVKMLFCNNKFRLNMAQ